MDYSIIWKTPTGEYIGNIDTQFIEVEWAIGEMSVGVLNFSVPHNDNYQVTDFGTDQIISVKRLVPLATGRGEDTRLFFVRDLEANKSVIRVTCYDLMFLLSGRIVDAFSGSAGGSKTGFADDVIKAFVRENIGSSAGSGRVLSNLSVDADTSKGYSVSRAAARDNLLTVCQEVAAFSAENGSYISFDIEASQDHSLIFKTYPTQRGVDRTMSSGNPVVVGERYGSAKDVIMKLNSSRELNFGYCGGRGTETERELLTGSTTRTTATPYNRREFFIDARNAAGTNELSQAIYAALQLGRSLLTLEGKIVESPGFRYGIDYDFGDRVIFTAFDYTTEARLSVAHVKIGQDGKQETNIIMKSEGLV